MLYSGFIPSPVGKIPPNFSKGAVTYPLVWPGWYPFAFPIVGI
jgi:hypothetical protein